MTQPSFPPIQERAKVAKKRRRKGSSPAWKKLRRRLSHIFNVRIIMITLVVVVLVFGVVALVLITDANNRIENSAANLNRVIEGLRRKPSTELSLEDYNRLKASVNDLERNLSIARQQTLFLRLIAPLNSEIQTNLAALDASEELALAAQNMVIGLEPTIFFLVEGEKGGTIAAQISSGERISELLDLGGARFHSADSNLRLAQSKFDAMQLDGISPSLLLRVESLKEYHEQLQDINSLLIDAPELLNTALGLSEDQTYLILAQNSDELRPSGGYISTFGWMVVRDGRVTDYNYSPTTTTSPNPPPDDFAAQLTIPDWWLDYRQPIYAAWDGSWYADFTKTADMARSYYDSGNNPHSPVQGVFAIDIVGFEYIMQALGSVSVPGYDQIVTSENFREVVYTIRAEQTGDLEHKEFLAALYKQIFADWQDVSHDQNKRTDLYRVVVQALREKHIMLYFPDEGLNRAMGVLDWSGVQDAALGHDYLMAADANLGNKSNRSITRQITYDVQIQPDGSLQCRAAIAYDYPAFVAENDPAVDPNHHGPLNYNFLLQVFTPVSSTLTGTDNLPPDLQTDQTETHTDFVAQVEVPYDTNERFQLSYTTPMLIERFGSYHRYRLLLQKQPGTLGDVVTVQVTLPRGTKVISTSPQASANFEIDSPILEFRLQLLTDQWIEVIYQ